MQISYIYILKCADDSYYTGVTSNLEQRMYQHDSAYFPDCYTASRRPVELVFYAEFTNIGFAIDKEKRTYSATIEVVVFDHFGLDRNDIDPKIKPEFALLAGFRSWFVLQHSTRFCKKPFVTLVHLNRTIYGTY